MTHVGESWENPSQVLRVNVLGTAEMLAAARTVPARRPGCWSSARPRSTAWCAPEQLPLDEDAPTGAGQPVRGQQAGRRGGGAAGLAGLRPAGDRGPALQPHRSGPVAQLRRAGDGQAHRRGRNARALRSLRVGTLTTRRDFTDVRDVVVAYRLLVERGEPAPSTTCARARTWPWPTWRTSCSSWPAPTSSS